VPAPPKQTPARPRGPRRSTLPMVVAGVALLAAALWFATSRSSGSWPSDLGNASAKGFNLLVITLDTTRADHLGCYGDKQAETPVLDALAESGVRFAHTVCAAPLTLPSHSTIFTGLYPPNHGARNNGDHTLKEENVTLAEILKDKGYQTGGFVSAFILDARFGLNQGFDHYDNEVSTDQLPGDFMDQIAQRPADAVTDTALRWIESRQQDRPFFAWVHYYDPHSPYLPPPDYAARFPDRLYDGEIAFMDSQIGRLLAGLDREGLRDNTLIVVVGDHGESLGEHDETTHALLVYDSSMTVPFILSCPGVFGGGVVLDGFTVGTVDVMPTILDLLGIPPLDVSDGISLVQALPSPDRVYYMETYATFLNDGWAPLTALRRHTDKYILAPMPEYYDLANDPHELDNVYDTVFGEPMNRRDELVADLAARLAEWPSIEGLVKGLVQLDPETIRQLESLGYVGTGSGAAASSDLASLPDPKSMMPVQRMTDEARALKRDGRLPEALALLQRAEKLSPKNNSVLHSLGTTLLGLGREAEAAEFLAKANAVKPRACTSLLLAQIKIRQKDFRVAAPLLKQAKELDPNFGGIYIALGDLLGLTDHPKKAIEAYEMGKEIDPFRVKEIAEARIQNVYNALRASGRSLDD